MFLAEDIKRLRDVNTNVVTPAREKFRQQRSKAWIDGLRSLINRDKSGLLDSVSRLVGDFKKRDLQLPQSRVVVSWDASILLALARLRNSWEVDYNHEVFDYIFTQESLAIT
jgi:hypothetical protein